MSQYPLRLPDSLMAAAKKAADEDNVSMNQLFVSAIAEKVSALQTARVLRKRGARADFAPFDAIMARVPDMPPVAGDELSEE
ncbi:MAG: hypothetical protein ACM31L_08860 [Actinomycetota bacterium]